MEHKMLYQTVLDQFVSFTKAILQERLTGVYLHGSLAMGCFHPEQSDIDLIVVISEDISDSQKKLLMEEGLSNAEAFVTLTSLDEENILLSLFAKKISSAKLITKVNRIAFDDIVEGLDLGSIIYPRYITADYILRYVRAMGNSLGSNVETLYHILDGQAEALEFSVKETPQVTGVPLSRLELKDNLLIACINRNRQILIPRGQDALQPGDTVIVVTTAKGLNDLKDILKKK